MGFTVEVVAFRSQPAGFLRVLHRELAKMVHEESQSNVILAAEIVSAYISNNAIPIAELPNLISSIFSVLAQLSAGVPPEEKVDALKPAVPIKKSFSQDFIICLEDGRTFKSLKRHLRTHHNMTPEQYRAKWQLAPDYPIVAPGYAEVRSRMAKTMGLGQQRRGRGRGRGRGTPKPG